MNYKMEKLSVRKWLFAMKHNQLKWLTVILCLFLLSGCSLFPKEEQVLAPPLVKPAKVIYNTIQAKEGSIENTVDGIGSFIPIQTTDLSFKNPSGHISKILVKNGDHVTKGQLLIELDTGDLSTQIAEQKLQLEKADLKILQLQNNHADKYSIDMAKLDKESVQLQLIQLDNQLAESRLTAPSDGVITNLTSKKAGDSVQAYEPLVELVNPHVLQFIYKAISAEDLSDVQLGMNATVTLHNGKNLTGKVVRIPGSMENDLSQSANSVIIQINNLPSKVNMGDSGNLQIITKKKNNTLIIPKQALHTFMSENYVQVLEGNSKKQVDVQVGMSNATEVEILKGIKAGEKVILQ
jgi:membrane fusion protein, macrolide-specific efflux system